MVAVMAVACVVTPVVSWSSFPARWPILSQGSRPLEQVEAAKHAEAVISGEVGQVEAELALADERLDQLNLQVDMAVESYLAAVYQLQIAEQAAKTTARGHEADVALETARRELGRFASASYRTGET